MKIAMLKMKKKKKMCVTEVSVLFFVLVMSKLVLTIGCLVRYS